MPKPSGSGSGGGGKGGSETVFAIEGETSEGTGLFGTGDPVLDGSTPTRTITVEVTDGSGTVWTGSANWTLQNGTWYWTIDYAALINPALAGDTFDDENGTFTVIASYEEANKRGQLRTVETQPYSLTILPEDTTAPTASAPVLRPESDSGISGDGITNDRTATFRVDFDATVAAGDTITLVVNGTDDVTRQLTQADIDLGHIDLTTTSTSLREGSNTVTARLSDGKNPATTTAGTALVLDTTAPAATIDALLSPDGTDDPDRITSDTTPTLRGTAEAGATVELLDAQGALLGSAVSTDGTWSIASSGLADGEHLLRVRVTDAAGNSTTSAAFALTVDTTVESAAILGVSEDTGAPGDGITSDSTPMIRGVAEPGSTVILYAVVNDAPVMSSGILAAVAPDGSWTVEPGQLPDGSHRYRALVTDAAGNQAWTADLTLVVDTIVAAALLTEVLVDDAGLPDSLALGSGGTTTDSSPLLRGTAEPSARVDIYVDGVLAGSTTADGAGNWSYGLTGLAVGSHAVTLKTADLAGNTAGDPAGPPIFTFVVEPPPAPATDPLFAEQWNLQMLGGIEEVWKDYTGAGVTVAIYDDGIAYDHVDLDGNYDASRHLVWNGSVLDPAPTTSEEAMHGTAVAGIIASERNGEGTIGIAYDATLVGVNIFSGAANINSSTSLSGFQFAIAEMDRFDVVNHSWGAAPTYLNDDPELSPSTIAFLAAAEEAVTLGRGGLGTIVLKAAGNWADSAQGDAGDATRFSITVGAYDSDGDTSWYSNRGANILVSAPSSGLTVADASGTLLPESDLRIATTDRDGAFGYADGSWSSANATSGFGGTSAATPTAAGVVALMLEANPLLGWRDVQTILAQSAVWTGSAIGTQNTATEVVPVDLDSDGIFETREARPIEYFEGFWNGGDNWNGGGMHFSEDYGFGAIDARSAVRMAEVWTLFGEAQTSANEAQFSTGTMVPTGLSVSGNGSSASWSFDYAGPAMDLEYVDITIQLSTTLMQEVFLSITSPDGTTVTLLDLPINDYTPAFDFLRLGLLSVDLNWTFGANAFRGEDPNGTWTVTLQEKDVTFDVDNYGREYDGNTIDTISFDFYGSSGNVVEDDVYTYTDEMLSLGLGGDSARVEVNDLGGTDWLNLAAMTADIDLDLSAGISANAGTGPVQIASFASGTVIEHAVTGDGDDSLVGNDGDNMLLGMRGNDTIEGGAGSDELSGHFGDDILSGGLGADVFYFEAGHGNDRILDFSQDFDTVALYGFAETSFDQLSFGISGTDQVLSFSSGDSLTFAGAGEVVFAADDFWFGGQLVA